MALSTRKYISPALGKASKKRVYKIENIKKKLTHRLRSGGREASCLSVYRGKWLSPMAVLFAVLAFAFLLKPVLAVVPAFVLTST